MQANIFAKYIKYISILIIILRKYGCVISDIYYTR